MEKTIYIDEQPIRLKSSAGLPKRYKAQFRRDYFGDLLKLSKVFENRGKGTKVASATFEDLDHLDMDVIYDIIWTMAKTADRNIPEPLEWLDEFEVFPLAEIMPQIQELITGTMQKTKKK